LVKSKFAMLGRPAGRDARHTCRFSSVTLAAYLRLETGGAIRDDEILEAIDASYAMVVSKLPKKDRPAPP
jgi:hypothetical protein